MSRSVSCETNQKYNMTTTPSAPKNDGIHSVYGLYIGGSSLNQVYEGVAKFSHASPCYNEKGLAAIKQNLVNACDSSTSLEFDGKLEAVGSFTIEMKKRFLTLLQCCVEEHGQQTFYFSKDVHNTMVNLFNEVHNFTFNMVVSEFHLCTDSNNVNYASFDTYKQDRIMLSRLVIESYLSAAFFKKIIVRYGLSKDFRSLTLTLNLNLTLALTH
jgi:hypothetical protein